MNSPSCVICLGKGFATATAYVFALVPVGALALLLAPLIASAQTGGPAPPQNRPQEPVPPFPYRVIEVTVAAGSGVTLAGTLTIPKGDGTFPAVLLITGAGAQDRDEALFGHKPFLVLADHLTRRGIAVLRLDDRGVGASTGSFEDATEDDLIDDVVLALQLLAHRQEVNPHAVGLIGHSEGGAIGPLAALRSQACVSYLVLLAAPGMPIDQIQVRQDDEIARTTGVSQEDRDRHRTLQRRLFQIVKDDGDTPQARERARDAMLESVAELSEAERQLLGATKQAMENQIDMIFSNSFRRFLAHDPVPALRRTCVPVLALNGEKDLQVAASENLMAINSALSDAKNPDFATVALPGLNHLFQNCRTGAPAEYGQIEETFDRETLQRISDWILARFSG